MKQELNFRYERRGLLFYVQKLNWNIGDRIKKEVLENKKTEYIKKNKLHIKAYIIQNESEV